MKSNRTYCIDEDIIAKMKNEDINASALINDLLRTHFNKEDLRAMSKEELKIFIEKQKLKRNFDKQMEVLNGKH
jgi:hypothetical protein